MRPRVHEFDKLDLPPVLSEIFNACHITAGRQDIPIIEGAATRRTLNGGRDLPPECLRRLLGDGARWRRSCMGRPRLRAAAMPTASASGRTGPIDERSR